MKKSAFIMTLLILCLSLLAPQAYAEDEATDFTLSNGLKVIFLPIRDNQVVSLSMILPGTSLRQTKDTAGIEDILMSVMERGSSKYPGDEIHKALDKYGSSIYHSTGKDFSTFSMTTVAPFFRQTLDIFADAWLNPELADKEIELARQKQLSYLRSRENDPDEFLTLVLNDLYYKNHPYHNDVDGNIESVTTMNKEQLTGHHNILINCGAGFIVVAGNLNKNILKQRLEQYFGNTSRTQYPGLSLPAFEKSAQTFTRAERNLPTHYIMGKFDVPPVDKSDYAALKMGLKILSHRLWEEVRTKRGLTYAISSSASFSNTNYGYIYLNTTNMQDAMSVIFNEFDKIRNEEVDENELKATKAVYKTQHFMSIEPNHSQASYLALGEVYLGDYKKRHLFVDQIEKTTAKSIKQAMNKYLKTITFAVVGTTEQIDQNLFVYKPETVNNDSRGE